MKELVVISGKGGTGKTTVTAGLAALGDNQVLADCDVDAADLHLILSPKLREEHEFVSGEIAGIDQELCTACGECLEHCRYGAVTEDFRVITAMCEGCGVCEFVCPTGAAAMSPRTSGRWNRSDTRFGPMVHAALGIGEENSGKLVALVRKQARELAEEKAADFLLTDGPPGIGCPVIASLGGADMVLAVTEPSVSAVSDLHRVVDLAAHFDIPALVLINKHDVNPELSDEIESYCWRKQAPVIGRLPYDPAFIQAQIRGISVPEFDPLGFGKDIESIRDVIRSRLEEN
jgi:MinD superfamily P-loop ATPase